MWLYAVGGSDEGRSDVHQQVVVFSRASRPGTGWQTSRARAVPSVATHRLSQGQHRRQLQHTTHRQRLGWGCADRRNGIRHRRRHYFIFSVKDIQKDTVPKVFCCYNYCWVKFTTGFHYVVGFGIILQKTTAVCCIMPVYRCENPIVAISSSRLGIIIRI